MFWMRWYRNRVARARRGKGRGQAVVEFALVMILFLMFLLALIDLGRVWFTLVAMENAAAEGALFGMANPSCFTSAQCGDPDNIEYRVKNESNNVLIDPSQISVFPELDPTDPGGPGTYIKVGVSYPFKPILPFLSAFGAGTIPIYQEAIQLIP